MRVCTKERFFSEHVFIKISYCIFKITLHNVCAVQGVVQYTGDVPPEGYAEYTGVLSTPGDTQSTPGYSVHGRYHHDCGDIMSTSGGFQYTGGTP